MDINELLAKPDFVITEKEAIDEGAIVEMDAYGIAIFRGDPVRTVSDTLFRTLQDAFGLAATAGLTVTVQDWAETLAERAAVLLGPGAGLGLGAGPRARPGFLAAVRQPRWRLHHGGTARSLRRRVACQAG